MDNLPHTNVERLLSVVAIQQEIASAKLDLETVMDLVVERVRPLTGADGAAVELVEGDELVYRAVSGMLSAHLGTRLEIDASISGLCVRGGEILRSDDTEADERVDREITRRIGARSMVVVPLHHDRRTVGVLKVSSAKPGTFGEEEVYTLQLITGLIAAGMSHTAQFEAEQALLEERTRALKEIQRSEERLRTIFEQSAVGIAETDLDGRFVLLNQRYCEITGYSREELLNLRMQDITHPDDLPENMRLLERLWAEGAEFGIEKRYVRRDGSLVWVNIDVSPRWNGSDDPVHAVAVVQDITGRKRREANTAFLEEVTEEITRLSSAGEIMRAAGAKIGAYLDLANCLSVDVDETRDEGLVENIWSAEGMPRAPEAIRLSDYVSEDFYHASRAGEVLAICDTETDARTNARACSDLDIRSFVTVPFHRDGEWKYLLALGDSRPRDWREDEIELVRNLSDRIFPRLERARAEQALRQSEESYRHLFEQSGELLLVHDGEGRILDCNEQACAAHGYSRREMLSMRVSDLTDTLLSEEEKRSREANGGTLWQRVLAGESARAEDAHIGENIRKDGTRFPVEVRASGITYGGQTMILASLRDITDRERAEKELRNALRDARQYASQLQELREAGLMIGSGRSLDEVLKATTDLAREIVGAHQSVTSLTIDEDWSQSITSVSLSEKYAGWRDYGEQPDGSGLYSEVCRTNLPMRMTQQELEAHPAFKGFGEAADRHPPMRGWLAAPLIGRDGNNIGVLQLSDRYECEFTGTDEAILVQLAQMASVALENARLYAESRESEFRYRSLVEGLDAIVWEARAPDLAFSFVSYRAEDILGYPPEKWLAEPGFLLARIHPEDRPEAESFYEAAASGVEVQEPVEYRVKSAAGREVWIRDEVRVIRDEGGNLLRLTGLMADVSEIKRAEQALLEIREAERRRIARDLHDSVLQDISGALQTIQALQAERSENRDSEDDGLEQSLGALRHAVGGLREAIYDLRRDDERPLIHEVEALVELNRQMAPECGLTLHVERQFPRDLPEAVSRELLRIVHEGLVNIRRHSGARRANVTLGAEGGEAWAGIFDDGRGFDQARTPEGMGLSGMRERVAAMGGKLQVRSEPNRGTSVTMMVPLSSS